jgi:tetratricopeptide (TPR) repeat protein
MNNETYLNIVLKICFVIISLMVISGCAFPRIVVLDDPLSPEEHINLGVTYEKQGDLANAFREYKKASEKMPIAYLYMGNISMQKNDYVNAEVYYKKAIKKVPDNADSRNNLAWLYYLRKEKLDEAEKLAIEAITLNPEKEDVYRDTLNKIRQLTHE